ncbi:MAG: hypothetical protein MK080_06325 [Opitutales bacterium]|nr:hypothetical protein [Opitutales bacterium]NRA27333.1 hypothetical protein [Opitutales bacterium]
MDSKKKFDAIEASCKWREATGARLSAMSRQERLIFLNDTLAAKLQTLSKKKTSTHQNKRSVVALN